MASFTTLTSPATPSITSPTASETGISRNPTITSSAFSSAESLSHSSSDWQIATDSGFSSVVWSKTGDSTNKTSITVNASNGTFAGTLSGKTKLNSSTNYYVRVRYTDSESTVSSYSTGVLFTTIPPSINKNSVDVQSPWTINGAASKKLPDSAAKPATIGYVEEDPTFDAITGSIYVNTVTGDVWYMVDGTWISMDARYVNVTGDTMTGELVTPSLKIGDSSNYSYFDSTGHLTFTGTAKPWTDIRIEPTVRALAGAGIPVFEKYFDDAAGTSKGVYLYSFTDEAVAGNEKEIFFTLQMPHEWDGGNIHVHVHFVPAATVNTSDIVWGLEYTFKEPGATYGDTTIITTSTLSPDDANIAAGKHYIAPFAAITPGTTADGLSAILIGRLFRNSSAAGDTYTDKVGLLYVDAHFQLSSVGSTDEYTK